MVLILFLGEIRSALIVALSIPFCMLIAFVFMRQFGLSANLMSLGGLAIGIGMLVDASIVVVENIYRHLSSGEESKSVVETALDGTLEVGRPILFAVVIIITVFLPLITLQGVEGKMFRPMAFTIAFALIGSLIMALVIAPVLTTFLLRRKTGIKEELMTMRFLKWFYRPALVWSICHRWIVIFICIVLLLCSLALVPFLGTEFMPTLEEGSILIRVTMAPSISLIQATNTVMALERKLVAFPEVKEVISRIGRPEAGAHPHPVNYSEIHLELTPISEWKTAKNKNSLINKMEEALSVYPGVQLSFAQPIQNVFEELLAGVKSELAVKVFGDDLEILRRKADEIREAVMTNISQRIVRIASEEHFDLIVMGTRGLGGAKAWLLGSVSQRVITEAPCPVLVVK